MTMDYQLTVAAILRRAEQHFPEQPVITRRADGSYEASSYGALGPRARRLASALTALGIPAGARIATLCASHREHLEAYYAAPLAGFVVHPLNPRLHAGDLSYIAGHAQDAVLIVDEALLGVYRALTDPPFEHVFVVGDSYETLLAGGDPDWIPPDLDEHTDAFLGYTSGTTGRPKGVRFTHRAIALHALCSALNGGLGFHRGDVVMPVVPMFHAMAWGWPYTCAVLGATLMLPGPDVSPAALLESIERQRVTVTGGVPTVWLGLLRALDAAPGRHDTGSLRSILVGGSAAAPAMIEAFERRHAIRIVHTWGMTELAMGLISEHPPHAPVRDRQRQGVPLPFLEIRARGEHGLVPWDGETMGELEVRGPWVADAYVDATEPTAQWTNDGWFGTGDIVTIDTRGSVEIQDRAKDLVKSGGEWISSSALESALLAHPGVREAAVIAVADPRWVERPLALVVLDDADVTAEQLRAHLEPRVARWWIPETIRFVSELPKTAVGKIDKRALRAGAT